MLMEILDWGGNHLWEETEACRNLSWHVHGYQGVTEMNSLGPVTVVSARANSPVMDLQIECSYAGMKSSSSTCEYSMAHLVE